ncbi:hypothetical protein SH2C18_39630 [Clostridium sediminicola]|uniref:hypothetical protein n=1 Tax=Clostridium sediminicola TaxID=3114879 RepID=UPI0031F2357B
MGNGRITKNELSSNFKLEIEDLRSIVGGNSSQLAEITNEIKEESTTPRIYNPSSFFKVGKGFDAEGNDVGDTYKDSILNGQIDTVKFEGRTLTNLLGSDGDCEDKSLWQSANSTDVINYSDDKVYGNQSLKSIASGNGEFGLYKDISLNINNYFILSVYVKRLNDNQTHAKLAIRDTDWHTLCHDMVAINSNEWVRVGLKVAPNDINTKTIHRININSTLGVYVSGDELLQDAFQITPITLDEYNNLTTDELLQKHPYINNTKSTICAQRFMSINKNLAYNVKYFETDEFHNSVTAQLKKIKPNTQYTLSIVVPMGEKFYTNERLFTTSLAITGTGRRHSVIVTTKDIVNTTLTDQYIEGLGWRIFKNHSGYSSSGNACDLQIEEGSTQTDYVPYEESLCYAYALDENGEILTLSSVGDAKDEVNFVDKKVVKRTVKDKCIIKNATGWTEYQEKTTTVGFYKSLSDIGITNIKLSTNLLIANIELFGINFPIVSFSYFYDNDVECIAISDAGNFVIRIDKTRLASIDSVGLETWLQSQASIILNYELVTPKEYDLIVKGEPYAYKDGHVQISSYIPKEFVYTDSKITLPYAVEGIDILLNSKGEEIAKEDITLADDGSSFMVIGAINGDVFMVYAPIRESENAVGVFSAKYLTGGVKSQVEGLNRGQQEHSKKIMTLEDTMRMFIVQNL